MLGRRPDHYLLCGRAGVIARRDGCQTGVGIVGITPAGSW